VLLQHGLLDSCDSWIANFEDKATAFILVNLGYDVWLGNNRGNKYGRKHVKLNPDKDNAFWEYSFHEMAKYDLPAIVDYIIAHTTKDKLTYVGHSQGTAQMFAGMAMDPEFFKARINGVFALGPISRLKHVGSTFLKYVAKFQLDYFFQKLGIIELFQNTDKVNQIQALLCKHLFIICDGLLSMIADTHVDKDDNAERFLVFIAHYPAGTSLRSLRHFAEMIRGGNFSPLGVKEEYNYKNIKDMPLYLFVGKDDRLATVEDNRIFKEILKENGSLQFYREYDDTGHASFFISETNNHIEDLIFYIEALNKYD